jgi:regulator of protease activity HflC (stomatin/prohibitin superfamily)
MRGLVIGIIVAVLAFIIVVPSIRVIGPTETAVVTRFGTIVGTLDSGVAWQFWMTDNVQRFDLTLRQTQVEFAARSVDAQPINGSLTIQWNLQPQHAEQIVREFGSIERLEDRMASAFMDNALRIFARRDAMFANQEREALRGELEHAMREAAPEFRISIANVHMGELLFNQTFNDAVNARVAAQEEANRAQEEARRNVIIAEGQRDAAAAAAQAVVIAAQADADALSIVQEAWGDLGTEVREIMLRQMALERWNGILPQVIVNGSGDDANFSLILDSINP